MVDVVDIFHATGAPSPEKRLPWEQICDVVVCLTTRGARKLRWRHLRRSLEEADLTRMTKILLSERPCDVYDRACDVLDACMASHFSAINWAKTQGHSRVLILEDDAYFDVPMLPKAIQACAKFLEMRWKFSVFLFGGVYTETQPTCVPHVVKGKGVQAHAWLINLDHPIWGDKKHRSKFRMVDIYNYHRGETYMVYPDVAFQRDFSRGERQVDRPVYDLKAFPFPYGLLTRIGLHFGMRNCWEDCARRTNSVVEYAGSIDVALIVLLTFVLTSSVVIIWPLSKALWRKVD